MKKEAISKISILAVILTLFLTSFVLDNLKDNRNLKVDTLLENSIEVPNAMVISPNSRPIRANQNAIIQETFLSPTLPFNTSYTLLSDWKTQNTTINYEGISYRKNWVQNGDFATSSSGWAFKTNNTVSYVTPSWVAGYVVFKVKAGTIVQPYHYGYWEQNITIPDQFAPGMLSILSFDNYYKTGTRASYLQLFATVLVGGKEFSQYINLTDIDLSVTTSFSFSYDPTVIGQYLPGNATIRLGIIPFQTEDLDKDQEIRFDNIVYRCWVQPNKTQIINVMDCESRLNYTYINNSSGYGTTYIPVQRQNIQPTEYFFTISKNDSYSELIISSISVSTYISKSLNSTYNNQIGSYYSIVSGEVNWETKFYFVGPSNYINMTIQIEYPSDWQITHIYDCYEIDRLLECSGTSYGQTTITIPTSIFEAGLWEINAISYNYVDKCDLLGWNGSEYINQSEFYMSDRFQLKIFLNNSISLTGTTLNLTIRDPNNGIFYFNSFIATSILILGDFFVGDNMTIGSYRIVIEWANNNTVLSCDKVGYLERNLAILHHTSLSPVETDIVRYENEPLLMKMNFTDIDLNLPIEYASLTYNCTSGSNGSLIYLGSGIYAADINTALLGLGTFIFSFNASKIYHQNLSLNEAVTLIIVPDRLSLDVPRAVLSFPSNSYAYFEFNLTGEFFGDFLTPANISTNWPIAYSTKDWNNGTYGLNLSTFELTTTGVPETFTVIINVNKTNYGYDSDSISFTVEPSQAKLEMNQSVLETYLLTNFSIAINYTDMNTGQKIHDSLCTIFWDSSYQVQTSLDGFTIQFSTNGLISEYYTGYIELSHNGYETIRKAFFVFIKPLKSELNLNQTVFETFWLDNFSISANFTNAQTKDLILDGTCEVIWDSDYQILITATGFQIEFSTDDLLIDTYTGYIQVNRSGYETIRKTFYVSIKSINAELTLNQSVIETFLLDNFSISVNFRNAKSEELIIDGTCEVIWASLSKIQKTATGFNIEFSTYSLTADYFMGYIQVNRSGYETVKKVFYVVVKPIKTTLLIQNPGPIRFIKGDNAILSCNLFTKNQILDSANLTFMGLNLNSLFEWNGSTYNFAFDTSNLEIKSYLIQILATGENLESNIIDLVFEINPLSLKLEISESFITIQSENNEMNNAVKFRIYDESHGIYRTDLDISYTLDGQTFEELQIEDNFYFIYLDRFHLTPSNEPYQLSVFVLNYFGNNLTAQINLFVPIPASTENRFVLYLSLVVSAILTLAFSGYIYKKNFKDLTKFQRDIRDFKKSILNKQPIKVLPETSRNMLVLFILKKQYNLDH